MLRGGGGCAFAGGNSAVGVSYQPPPGHLAARRASTMTILRRTLQALAAIYAGCGLALMVAPRWILTDWFQQPQYADYTYVRVAGAMSFGLALLAVMVSRRDDAWWWAWAFAVVTGLCGTITALHALFDVPAGAGVFLWWLFAAISWGLTAGFVLGLTRASQEHPLS